MILEYVIKVQQHRDEKLATDLYQDSEAFKVIKGQREVILRSTDSLKGSGFKKSNKMVSLYKESKDFIIGYEPKLKFETVSNDFKKEIFPIATADVQRFLSKYRNYINILSNNRFVNSIKPEDTLYLVYIEDGVLKLLDKSLFELDFINNKIEVKLTPLPTHTMTVNFTESYEYDKSSDDFTLDFETLLDIKPGFYNVFPKKTRNNYYLKYENDMIEIENRAALKLYSDVKISFDNLNHNEFLATPNNKTEISYCTKDLTPLSDIEAFDYTDSKQYLVYELVDNTYNLVFKLPLQKEEEDFKTLMKSHVEFKRPYSFTADRSEVTIKEYDNNLLETITIESKDFSEVYGTP